MPASSQALSISITVMGLPGRPRTTQTVSPRAYTRVPPEVSPANSNPKLKR